MLNSFYLLLIAFLFVITLACDKKTALSTDSYVTHNKNTDSAVVELNDKQKKILDGAKKCLNDGFSYDMSMAYHVLTYKDNINTGKKVYPGGDLDPSTGVCTDVTIRALRYSGLYDLQKEIHQDIVSNFSDYPMKRWSAKKADSNIDHRRVPNQLVWLTKYFDPVKEENIQPADIIVWDMNDDTWGDHIGIASDKISGHGYFIIHNFPSPGYVAEEDVLNKWNILGIFRVK